jgi:uncharacterized ferritin-like protein (DUF455 family)
MRKRPPPERFSWRRDNLARPLLALAYFERSCAHIMLGWLPKIVAIEHKLALGQHQYQCMQAAAKLESAYGAMQLIDGIADRSVPSSYLATMRGIDNSADVATLVRQLYGQVKTGLVARYREIIGNADPTLDAHLLETLQPILSDAEQQIAWARAAVAKTPRGPRDRHALFAARGPRIARDRWLWRPLERLPQCARPEFLGRKRPGELAPSLTDPPGSAGSFGQFFHHLGSTEISTMELFARCSYEHPDMPEAFHLDYSRIAADEARHAAVCMRKAAEFRRPLGTYTIDTDSYDAMYQFRRVRQGSKRELLWRLLITGTVRESLMIEGFMMQAKKMRHVAFAEAARVTETMAEEEIAHVEAAAKWSRHLCGGSDERVIEERERANAHYRQALIGARNRYVKSVPDTAIEETRRYQAYLRSTAAAFPFSLKVRVNHAARAAAGMTRQQIDQLLSWRYINP